MEDAKTIKKNFRFLKPYDVQYGSFFRVDFDDQLDSFQDMFNFDVSGKVYEVSSDSKKVTLMLDKNSQKKYEEVYNSFSEVFNNQPYQCP